MCKMETGMGMGMEEASTARLKKEVEDLEGKNYSCQEMSRTIRKTELEIVELEKTLSEESVQCRATRERQLEELAANRTRLTIQKRRLTELEGATHQLDMYTSEVKARIEARGCIADRLRTHTDHMTTLTTKADQDIQTLTSQKKQAQETHDQTSHSLTNANQRLSTSLKAFHSTKLNITEKMADKKTLEECLQKVTFASQKLRSDKLGSSPVSCSYQS